MRRRPDGCRARRGNGTALTSRDGLSCRLRPGERRREVGLAGRDEAGKGASRGSAVGWRGWAGRGGGSRVGRGDEVKAARTGIRRTPGLGSAHASLQRDPFRCRQPPREEMGLASQRSPGTRVGQRAAGGGRGISSSGGRRRRRRPGDPDRDEDRGEGEGRPPGARAAGHARRWTASPRMQMAPAPRRPPLSHDTPRARPSPERPFALSWPAAPVRLDPRKGRTSCCRTGGHPRGRTG